VAVPVGLSSPPALIQQLSNVANGSNHQCVTEVLTLAITSAAGSLAATVHDVKPPSECHKKLAHCL
jgi:hypothetical protein